MREYLFVMKDPMGLHARPVSSIFMEARTFVCSIEACWETQTADCKSLLSLMGLGVKEGGEVLFRFEGEDEDAAYTAIRTVLDAM